MLQFYRLQRRFWRIVFLFGVFLCELWLAKIIRFFLGSGRAAYYRRLYNNQAVRFNRTAVEMGGLLIKLGQFLSAHIDILPGPYIKVLSTLQDRVPPVAEKEVLAVIYQELGPVEQVFLNFKPEPIASASLGQVHKAVLLNGQVAAVKIQRPGIDVSVDYDLKALKFVICLMNFFSAKIRDLNLIQIYKEFDITLRRELDYVQEADSADRFRELLKNRQRQVYIPKVYRQYTTCKVLTLEYVTGIKVTDFEALKKDGINLERLAERLLSIFFYQVIQAGFFHADPHPGNMFVGPGGKIILVDFGMVGEVSADMRKKIKRLMLAILIKDTVGVIQAFKELEFLTPGQDTAGIERTVEYILNYFYGRNKMKNLDYGELAVNLQILFYSEPFQIPADVTFLGKTLVTLIGICEGLHPGINYIKVIRPYFINLLGIRDEDGEEKLYEQLVEGLKGEVKNIINLPRELNGLIRKAVRGEIRVRRDTLEHREDMIHTERMVNRVTFSVFLSASVLCTSIFYVSGLTAAFQWSFLPVGVFTLLLTANFRRSRHSPVHKSKDDNFASFPGVNNKNNNS